MGIKEILEGFKEKEILVIGDIMVDWNRSGEIKRISPEAPTLILNLESESFEPGGAANVASNISSLGGKVSLFGFIKNDLFGNLLKNSLREKGIEYFFEENDYTIVKERFFDQRKQQIFRADSEVVGEKHFRDQRENLREKARNSDLIVIADHAKGAITKDLMDFLEPYKNKMIIDPNPKNKNLEGLYGNCSILIPNEEEALKISESKDVDLAGEFLKEKFNSRIIITRGNDGISIFSDEKINIPTNAKEVYDVQGAGDTVVSALSLAIASGADLKTASIIGNHAAGISVSKRGTYSPSMFELKKTLLIGNKKVVDLEELKIIVENYRTGGKKIAWTNGCFDVFHSGHAHSIKDAKEYGDILIVGIDSDDAVKKLKGEDRPINNESHRADVIASLESVDYVTIYGHGGARKCLEELKPHVFFHSSGRTLETMDQDERRTIESYGGEIVLKETVGGLSSTNIINKIKNNP